MSWADFVMTATAARSTLVASCGRYTVKIKTTIASGAMVVATPTYGARRSIRLS
jgi:hypothetical protein